MAASPSLHENSPTSRQLCRFFRVHRRDLVYLKFVTEAYEGLLTLSTVDRTGVVVRISYSPLAAADVAGLLDALAREIPLEEVPPPVE